MAAVRHELLFSCVSAKKCWIALSANPNRFHYVNVALRQSTNIQYVDVFEDSLMTELHQHPDWVISVALMEQILLLVAELEIFQMDRQFLAKDLLVK